MSVVSFILLYLNITSTPDDVMFCERFCCNGSGCVSQKDQRMCKKGENLQFLSKFCLGMQKMCV